MGGWVAGILGFAATMGMGGMGQRDSVEGDPPPRRGTKINLPAGGSRIYENSSRESLRGSWIHRGTLRKPGMYRESFNG